MDKVYVYVYLDPRIESTYLEEYDITTLPIYVGIGIENRLNCHLDCALKGRYKQSYRINVINKMLREGCTPIILKLHENLTVDEAKEIEINLIAKIGTAKVVKDVKRGPLTNLTRGGDGMVGYVHINRHLYHRSSHNLGKVGMTKGHLRIMVNKEDLPSYLEAGWILGFGDKVKSRGTQDTKWMTNGIEKEVVKISDSLKISELQSLGWKFGAKLDHQKNTSSGKTSIFKDGNYRQVDPDQLSSFIAAGWKKRSPLTGRIRATRNGVKKNIKPDERALYEADGWVISGKK